MIPKRETRDCTGFARFALTAIWSFGTLFLQLLDVFESAFITTHKIRIDSQPFCP